MYTMIDLVHRFHVNHLRKLLSSLCLLAFALNPVGVLPSTPAMAQSGQMVQVRVVIERVIKGDVIPLYGLGQGDPDYYAGVTIDNRTFKTGKIANVVDVSPNWAQTWLVDRSRKSSIPIKIELFETDNFWGEFPVDINPQSGRDILLSVDLHTCDIHGDTGGTSSKCMTTLISGGTELGHATVYYHIEVIVPSAKIVIERIKALGDPPLGIGGRTIFAKVSIDNQVFAFDETKIEQQLTPNWAAVGQSISARLGVAIKIELFAQICIFIDEQLVCHYDEVDINPASGRSINFDLELSPCRMIGVITDFCTGGRSWTLAGNENLNAEIQFRVESLVAPPDELPDLVVSSIEVTQGIQDLNNSVRLVEGKPTFVRLHVFSTNGNHLTTGNRLTHAQLRITNVASGNSKVRTNTIAVMTNPNRGNVKDSFLFEIPKEFTSGFILLTAEVNLDSNVQARNPPENNYNNNTISRLVVFEPVPSLNLVLYSIGFGSTAATASYPAQHHFDALNRWLGNAYPIGNLNVTTRTLYVGSQIPDVDDINSQLLVRLFMNTWMANREPSNVHYYGIVNDLSEVNEDIPSGLDLIGRAISIPGGVATGSTQAGPDNGGHELGHAFGRYHAEFCDAPGGAAYPYDGGRISEMFTGDTALYGFQIINPGSKRYTIPDPTSYDLMTYCNSKWISDFTYEGLMDYFQNNFANSLTASSAEAMTQVLLVGYFDLHTQHVKLQPVYIVPNIRAISEGGTGDYTIVLRNQNRDELLRNTFSPSEVADVEALLSFAEFVPYVNGTKYVEIVGPQGVLHTITATASSPTVTLLSPNGGETITDSPIVSWTANDPDGDALTYMLQYSPDDGQSWEVVAQNITETTAPIDAVNLPAGDKARFRVWATDGFNTASDESDNSFIIPNHVPTINIISPISGSILSAQQTLSLQGDAYDIDLGSMPDEMLQWVSDRDGILASGDQSSVSGLSAGLHTISFQANDGAGAIVTDTVRVTVVADPSQLPTPQDELVVSSNTLVLEPDAAIPMRSIYLDNANLNRSLDWRAVSNQSWLNLDADSGTTPDHLTVAFTEADLPSGLYTATVTLTSTQMPSASVAVEVQAMRLADLAVQRIDAPTSVEAGKELYYTVIITNSGPASARGISIIDRLPKELTFIQAASTPGCSSEQNNVLCSLDALPVGGQVILQIATSVTSSVPITKSVINSIEVRLEGLDANLANNILTAQTTLLTSPTGEAETVEPLAPGNKSSIYLPLVQR